MRLAAEAEIIPVVLAAGGEVLTLGRTRRLASPSQTLASAARDGGCSFPGCGRAPELCERHHLVAWVDGELTNLDNLTLLDRYHHHFAERGWTCELNTDRMPQWRPPRGSTPTGTQTHHRILTAAQASPQLQEAGSGTQPAATLGPWQNPNPGPSSVDGWLGSGGASLLRARPPDEIRPTSG